MTKTLRHSELQACLAESKEFWTFRESERRQHAHGMLHYPAMMVPEMMGELIDRLTSYDEEISRIYDPFSGSGTVLTESMLRGLDFTGTDINPLAILACRVKASPYSNDAFLYVLQIVLKRAMRPDRRLALPEFYGRDKWFSQDVSYALATIHHAICMVDVDAIRRVMWLALAGVARHVCNSRLSTYKLHKTPTGEAPKSADATLALFRERVWSIHSRMNDFWANMHERGVQSRTGYTGKIDLQCRDVRKPLAKEGVIADAMITSPPYGDNTTTIPYGQFSYLPLNWIRLEDIGPDISREAIETAYALDHNSLGGSIRGALEFAENLRAISPTFRRVFAGLEGELPDRRKRLAAFAHDMFISMNRIVPRVRVGGYYFWVVGDRRIGGKSVELASMIVDLMKKEGCHLRARFTRSIRSKKMAVKNSIGLTMQEETILGFQRLS